VWATAAVALAATASGCSDNGGGSSSSTASPPNATGPQYPGGTSPSTPATSPAAGHATVGTASVGSLGKVLVGAGGRTLYLFEADTSTTSTCTGACAVAWPPLLTTGPAEPGSGVQAKLLGTTTRSGGMKQVTYHGHPLYFYLGDSGPGQAGGQGLNQFGALWYVLDANGDKVTKG
jgi:predicted lipoprotein with Yx(FWY)xxD motif